MSIVQNNSDFLFLFDATLCNPNGDPDQENKPRMDYDTKTNLVTDTRLKRSIRDYLKADGVEIFVDMEGENKVSPATKLQYVIDRTLSNEADLDLLFQENSMLKATFQELIKAQKDKESIFKALAGSKNQELNHYILAQLIKQKFVDIRMFGSAFAVGGFTKAYTGAIQINWGYSLHEVDLVDSNSIVTTMNDGSSTFGKDYRLHYSLLAFNGTINKYAAQSTSLTEQDRDTFRAAVWNAVSANPTRSKLNQYPQLYLEIVYNDGYSNGYFGDLRKHITVTPKKENVRGMSDLTIDFSHLKQLITENTGSGKAIKTTFSKTHPAINY
ncbi:type I CRISPR-associated protein Cas7 [Chitinophaga defluvii]|uniref:Type I CRISPR-associated protein Cas7 n=1 Tax=Chitinophaga defluvii TaxID=3163343 RepID=A0ABV2T1N3_9BACT